MDPSSAASGIPGDAQRPPPPQLPPPVLAPPVGPMLAPRPTPSAPPSTPPVEPARRAMGTRPVAASRRLADGIVVAAQMQPLRPTALRGRLMIASFAAVSGVGIALTAHFVNGYQHLDTTLPLQPGPGSIDPVWAKSFDRLTAQLELIELVLILVATIATALWSRRIAQNSAAVGFVGVSPSASTVVWFIPGVNLFAGFSWLRKAPRADWQIAIWQVLLLLPLFATIAMVSASVVSLVGQSVEYRELTREAVLLVFRNGWILRAIFAACFSLATLVAWRAVEGFRRSFPAILAESAALGG